MGIWYSSWLRLEFWDKFDCPQPLMGLVMNQYKHIGHYVWSTQTIDYCSEMEFQIFDISSHIFSFKGIFFIIHYVGKNKKLFTDNNVEIRRNEKFKISMERGVPECIKYSFDKIAKQDVVIDIPKTFKVIQKSNGIVDLRKYFEWNDLKMIFINNGIDRISWSHQKIIFFNVRSKRCMYCEGDVSRENGGGICKKCRLYGFCSRKCQKRCHERDPHHHSECFNGRISKANKFLNYQGRLMKEMIMFQFE